MNKKIFLFLSTFVLAITSLVAMGQLNENATPDFSSLPETAKQLIVGHLSDDMQSICSLSLASRTWANATHDLRHAWLCAKYEDCGPVNQLSHIEFEDYEKAIRRYANIYEIREKGYFRFRQDEFVALQDFILVVLDDEIGEPDRRDIRNYVLIPLSLRVNFHNITSSNGETPLHVAAMYGFLDIVQKLIAAGCDVNKTCSYDNSSGASALYLASVGRHLPVVKALLHAGANLNAEVSFDDSPEGDLIFHGSMTALQCARQLGFDEIAQAIQDEEISRAKKRACDPSKPDNFGAPESKRERKE